MIRSNLAVLLAENNLKITKVAHDTGISRTTLTALAQNSCKGIQLDTINTLCRYLNIDVDDLLEFIPIDVDNILFDCETDDFDTVEGLLYIDVYTRNIKYTTVLNVWATIISTLVGELGELEHHELIINLNRCEKNEDYKAIDILKTIPRAFLRDIEKAIANEIYQSSLQIAGMNKNNSDFSVSWNVFDK